jgi:sugar lactone lactonase YvrE
MKKIAFILSLLVMIACSKQQHPPPEPGPGDPGNNTPLTITTVTPDNAEAGPVTIKGTGFGATTGENIVRFGTLVGLVQSASPTQLVVALPGDLALGDHDVTVIAKTQTVTKTKGFHLTGWVVSNFAGTGEIGTDDGPGNSASFRQPSGLAVDDAGNLYVPDLNKIRKITPEGVVSTFAGANAWGSNDGSGDEARFKGLSSIVVDAANNLYVTDGMNFLIRKITADRVVSTVAGAADVAGYKDGIGNEALFSLPYGLAINAAGTHLFVGDLGNNRIRKIELATRQVTTIAGNGKPDSKDGNGLNAGIPGPGSMAFDQDGNLYLTEKSGGRVRKMAPNGGVTTIGGRLDVNISPTHVAVDEAKNVYVTYTGLGRIRKYTPLGLELNFAGNIMGNGPEEGPAQLIFFKRPEGIVYTKDKQGKPVFYVTDSQLRKIKKISKE